MEQQRLGIVQVCRLPQGSVPEDVRAAWLGLTLPALPECMDVVTRHIKGKVVLVPKKQGLQILKEMRPEAHAWYEKNPRRIIGEYLSFNIASVDIISGVYTD